MDANKEDYHIFSDNLVLNENIITLHSPKNHRHSGTCLHLQLTMSGFCLPGGVISLVR